MDRQHRRRHKPGLPRTPRVNDKIMEYYQKFGQDRDLEKFMRLYSPGGSQDSQKSRCRGESKASSTISSSSSCEALAMISQRSLGYIASKSMPNIDIPAGKDIIVDMNIELENDKENIYSMSTENVHTPKKTGRELKDHLKTPDSIAKTHKRLEWDSLGDVGYKKSMSTSNVSVLERSLLKEFFKENSVTSEPSNRSDNKEKTAKNTTNIKSKTEHLATPLASSTLVGNHAKENNGAKPKISSQSTATSLQKQFEKYVQTSLLQPKPQLQSQEIQCTISSSNSVVEGTATPSSFDYYSSRSSKSSKSNAEHHHRTNKQFEVEQQHPFISSITDLLMQRKVLSEQNHGKPTDVRSIKDLQAKFQAALESNKENSQSTVSSQHSFSLRKQAPELDLGIQLICSLIDAKSLNGKEKQKLIRDIVKRISRLSRSDDFEPSITTASSSSMQSSKSANGKHYTYGSVHTMCQNPLNDKNLNLNRRDKKTDEKAFNNSKKYGGRAANENLQSMKNNNVMTNITPQMNNIQVPPKQVQKRAKSNDIIESKTSAKKTSTTNSTTTSATTDSVSSTSSRDVVTQKQINKELNTSNTDAEQPTMTEWLNPLTQSEVEYEEKKRKEQEEIRRTQADDAQKKMSRKTDNERSEQLDWIENEIKRLESLKHLILKDDKEKSSTVTHATAGSTAGAIEPNKSANIYDSVCTAEKSSVLSESAERLVQEIQVILEESNEEDINLKDNLKRHKERRRETQIYYDGGKDDSNKPRCRITKETVTINEEQLLNTDEKKVVGQREKMDTPPAEKSTEKDGDSLRDLVQQRKREFLESYKSKKESQYEALKQHHRQEEEKFKKMYPRDKPALNVNPKSNAAAYSGHHYSVPHSLNRKVISNATHPQTNLPPIPAHEPSASTSSSSSSTQYANVQIHQPQSTSTSSMFCISSEASMQLGFYRKSAVSHDQPKNVAIQTSDSIKRSHPIFGPQLVNYPQSTILLPYTTNAATAAVQVKPKGIAYVIEFNANSRYNDNIENDLELEQLSSEPKLTLQEYLEKAKPEFLQQTKERKAILNQLQAMRQERDLQMRQIIDNASFNSLERHLEDLPPPPTQKVRVLKTKDMKALTRRRFVHLPEVLAKKQRELEDKRKRNNRIMREVFNRRLQKRVRSGKLSLNHSKTVI